MKSLQQFLEAQKFLVKGHTKKQDMDYVDLDLPSGIKWATCNIGANKPEEPGLLFQWGRIDGYKHKDKNHKFLINYYVTDYVTTSSTKYKKGDTLKKEDDAAYQATNSRFRIPTNDEIDELLKYTDNEWTELNGVKGRKFISKQDDSKWIFIPVTGYFDGLNGSFYMGSSAGYVWSSSVESATHDTYYFAYNLFFGSGYCRCHSNKCYDGYAVRGVLNK